MKEGIWWPTALCADFSTYFFIFSALPQCFMPLILQPFEDCHSCQLLSGWPAPLLVPRFLLGKTVTSHLPTFHLSEFCRFLQIFADFAEWQRCNNCSVDSSFNMNEAEHEEIEKMQLLFLQEKFEEKKKKELFAAVSDIVRLNGAMSRALSDGKECVVETSYSPDDVFSHSAFEIIYFIC